MVGIVKIKHRGEGGRSGRIRVIDVVRRGRKMNGTKETRGGEARASTRAPVRAKGKRRKRVAEGLDNSTGGGRGRTGRK